MRRRNNREPLAELQAGEKPSELAAAHEKASYPEPYELQTREGPRELAANNDMQVWELEGD